MDRLLSLKFNPLLSSCHRPLALSPDLDPEKSFFFDPCESDYYIEDQFNDTFSQKFDNSFCLSFLHLNIRSLSRNLCGLTNLLAGVKNNFSVIETWLQNSSHSVDIDGYTFVHNHRPDKAGGGVGLYITSELEFKLRDDLTIAECFESLFIEICRSRGKNIIVGAVYRPPNQMPSEFVSGFNNALSKISKENKLCYILSDTNLNLINHDCHQPTSEFLDLLYSYMFYPLITRPTRITSHSATLIDNIFTNNLDNDAFNGLFFTDVSDHLPIFSISRSERDAPINTASTTFRDKSASHVLKFKDKLKDFNWNGLSGFNDPTRAYDSFVKQYWAIYNASFPLKRTNARKCTLSKPWLSRSLLKCIRKKNRLFKRYLGNPTPLKEERYKKYKNKLTHSLRIAKRLYYETKLERSKSNIKSSWKILNEILNRKSKPAKLPSTFKYDNHEISNADEIANRFCEYFSNIGPNLAKNITASSSSHHSFLKGDFVNSLFLESTTQDEITELINNLRKALRQATTTFLFQS